MNPDEIIANPQRFGKEIVIKLIESLSQYQKTQLKSRIKELLRDETNLPNSEQNGIFISECKEILYALEEQSKGNATYDLIALIGLKDRAVGHLLESVKREEANIRKTLNVYLSAYTDEPMNLAYVSPSSTGKTYLVENVGRYFPAEDLILIKSISRKAFTRERGKLVLKEFTEDGPEYKEVVENAFTGKQITISGYLAYLDQEIDKKENKENSNLIEGLKEERSRIKENMITLIDFTDKTLVLLERPSQGFWADMMSVASHDSEYLESSFVEGEGKKYTKHIVYKHWPAIIFCTSKDEDFAWKDLETRFELAAPFESSEKFRDAIDLSLERKFGIPQHEDSEAKKIRSQIRQLVQFIKEQRPKAHLTMPSEIRKAFLGDKIERSDLMRKFPRLMSHIDLNALFAAPDRVIFKNNDGEHVLVSPDDFKELLNEFSNNELNAALHGFTESVFIFLNEILIPACLDMKGDSEDYRNPTQAEVCKALLASDFKLGKTKQRCGQYLRALEERYVIKRVQDEKDKRGLRIIPLIDELQKLSKRIEVNVEELVNTYKKVLPKHIEELLRQNFKAFHRGVDISKMHSSVTCQKLVKSFPDHDIPENNGELQKAKNSSPLVTSILERSGYFTTHFTNFSDELPSNSGDRFTNIGNSLTSDLSNKNFVPFGSERSRYALYRVKIDFKSDSGLTYRAGSTFRWRPTDEDVSKWIEEGKIEMVSDSLPDGKNEKLMDESNV